MNTSLFSSNLNEFDDLTPPTNLNVLSSVDLVKDVPVEDLVKGEVTFSENKGIETEVEPVIDEDKKTTQNNVSPESKESIHTRETEISKTIERVIEKVEPLVINTAKSLMEPLVIQVKERIIEPIVLQNTEVIKEFNNTRETNSKLSDTTEKFSNSVETLESSITSFGETIKTESEKSEKVERSEKTNHSVLQDSMLIERPNILNQYEQDNTTNEIGTFNNLNSSVSHTVLNSNPIYTENVSNEVSNVESIANDNTSMLERGSIPLEKPKEEEKNQTKEIQTAFEGAIKNVQASIPNTSMFSIEKGGTLVSNVEKEKTIEKTNNTNTQTNTQQTQSPQSNDQAMQTVMLSMIHEALLSGIKVKIDTM